MDRMTLDFSKDLYKAMALDLYRRIIAKGGEPMPCGKGKKKKGGRNGK